MYTIRKYMQATYALGSVHKDKKTKQEGQGAYTHLDIG